MIPSFSLSFTGPMFWGHDPSAICSLLPTVIASVEVGNGFIGISVWPLSYASAVSILIELLMKPVVGHCLVASWTSVVSIVVQNLTTQL